MPRKGASNKQFFFVGGGGGECEKKNILGGTEGRRSTKSYQFWPHSKMCFWYHSNLGGGGRLGTRKNWEKGQGAKCPAAMPLHEWSIHILFCLSFSLLKYWPISFSFNFFQIVYKIQWYRKWKDEQKSKVYLPNNFVNILHTVFIVLAPYFLAVQCYEMWLKSVQRLQNKLFI